ncbi:MAG: hypothetical protein HC884_02430 [Chloroflexaceae bacterium]|nr:hypothetical protein [Chloroflexaceae bacterium]
MSGTESMEMEEVTIQTDQLSLVRGVRHPTSHLVTVIEPCKRDIRRERLCLLVETETQQDASRDAPVARLVARTVQKMFYQDHSFSVMSSLRAAIRAANRAVYHDNLTTPTPGRLRVGVTCTVIQGGDVFIAQVAPSQMYVLTEGRIRALPEHPALNLSHPTASPSFRARVLGSSLFVEPDLYRCRLRSGELFVLCSSNLAPLLSHDEVGRMLEPHDTAAVVETLAAMCQQYDIASAHALAVMVRLSPRTCPKPSAHRRAQAEPVPSLSSPLPPIGAWLAGLSGAAVVSSAGGFSGPAGGATSGATGGSGYEAREQPGHRPPAMPPALPEVPGGSPDGSQRRKLGERLGNGRDPVAPEHQEAIDLGDAPLLAAYAHPYRPRHQIRPWCDMRWYELLVLPLRSVGVALADGFGKTRLRRSRDWSRSAPRRRGYAPVPMHGRERPPFSWFQLIALALLVTLLLLHGSHLASQSDRQRDLEYLEQARHDLEAVRKAPDEQAALTWLDRAERSIRRARASSQVTPANPVLWLPFLELERDYEQAMRSLHRLSYFEQSVVFARHPLPNGHFDSLVIPPASDEVTDTTTLEALAYGMRSMPAAPMRGSIVSRRRVVPPKFCWSLAISFRRRKWGRSRRRRGREMASWW